MSVEKVNRKFLVTRCWRATRADGFELFPPSSGSICRLERPASFSILPLTWLARPLAITEFAPMLGGAASSVVWPRAIRLMISTGGSGGAVKKVGFWFFHRPPDGGTTVLLVVGVWVGWVYT